MGDFVSKWVKMEVLWGLEGGNSLDNWIPNRLCMQFFLLLLSLALKSIPMLASANQGYIYQDILGAYLVANELARGKGETRLHFDYKKTPEGVPDRFDDLAIYCKGETIFIQVKYSNHENQHFLTKQDFSSSSPYDLALFDLFETWKALHNSTCLWRVCLAWDKPVVDDQINIVLRQLSDDTSILPGTICYQFNADVLWPEGGKVLSSWSALRNWSQSADRSKFKEFLDCLVLEVGCPKSTLLQDFTFGLERLLARAIENIGIGIYPNDHLAVRQVAESLCTIAQRCRVTISSATISCNEIAKEINIEQSNGGIEQNFPVDKTVLVTTPERVNQVVKALEEHKNVILTAEPGAGKSWFIENLEDHLQGEVQVVKHYCYVALEDPLAIKRISVNVLYGSLITQILKSDDDLRGHVTRRYASNLEQINTLLGKIEKKTLLIVDGIDHIWRVYQKNRGGLTEDETTILQALAQLNCSNPNISLLVVSQPITQLETHLPFFHCTLASLPEEFVCELLGKHAIQNFEVNQVSLSETIHKKSNGNGLYCKYLIEHAAANKTYTSFDWINELPSYEFNLTKYYQYLYEQIQGDTRVPCALCGVDFSLTEEELREITHLGNMATTMLNLLKPVLRYIPSIGYAIYHESFKRFIVDSINGQGAIIEQLIYQPLIAWLEKQDFFGSTKAYGNLLKLYYEVDEYEAITQTISLDFLDKSLYNAQPFHRINQNHRLQRTSLKYVDRFAPMLIIAEQAKIVYELEHITDNDKVLISYLKAVQAIHGEKSMYRVLWDGENLLISSESAFRFLASQACQGKAVVHWSIIPRLSSIPYEILGFVGVKHLHTKRYDKFSELIKNVYEHPEHKKAFPYILDEIEWWNICNGEDWITNTPYFQGILKDSVPRVSTLTQAVNRITQEERYHLDDDWEINLRDIITLTKAAIDKERETVINSISGYNWFRNWLIYLIKITELSQKTYTSEDVIDAFSYLVRDLEPFKGKPRACDLYRQLPFIKKSFHWGLLLCNGNEALLLQCFELLERVTNLTTSMQRSFTGPLTDEGYLELAGQYLSTEYVVKKYEEYYEPLGSRRVYSDVAETAFEYAYVLSNAGENDKAREKYSEGIQALTAYGVRKDRTFSEILYCSVPYQQAYGTLDKDWFYELYQMAMTVVTHTDGKSTSYYPVEWFDEFVKVFPNEALKFLVCETFESNAANRHQEEEFYHILEDYPNLFNPTQWFLLCRSLPLASAEKILKYGLSIIDKIDEPLQETYLGWLKSLPFKIQKQDESVYSVEVAKLFEQYFGYTLDVKQETNEPETVFGDSLPPFPNSSDEDVLAFFELHHLTEEYVPFLQKHIASITDIERKKIILLAVARSFKYGREAGEWVNDIFENGSEEWLYFNVCLFVFLTDGWFHSLHFMDYIKRSYAIAPDKTLINLKEVLGQLLSNDRYDYASLISCNLIQALSELRVDEPQVRELLELTFKIVKRRLPHPPNSEINTFIYNGLEGLNRDEIIVALLIARLKTLTTEKTQGILWSLSYIAKVAPETLFKPYYWAFSSTSFLLPIHRAVLLQVLKEAIGKDMIPDELVGLLLISFPTGFFLEDQLIRSFVGYTIKLDETSAIGVLLDSHQYDKGFFSSIHPKYIMLTSKIGSLNGSYNAYAYKRDEISKNYNSYYNRTEKVMTPIVSLANAFYEIINGQWYAQLKDLTDYYHHAYTCNLTFFLQEIVLQVGSLTKRPPFIPTPEYFPLFEVHSTRNRLEHDGWAVLASIEKELYGKSFESKQYRHASRVLTFGEEPTSEEDCYAHYLFQANHYGINAIDEAPPSQPICMLKIEDTLEHVLLIFIAPWIVRELGLTMSGNLHNGFHAVNNKGEVVIKMLTWKEGYYGSISDGTEVPRLEGVSVLIKAEWYESLLSLYNEEGWYVLRQSNEEKDI